MCGIAGIVDLRRSGRVSRGALGRMASRLEHRGPDQSGLYDDADCGLAFRRLAILDLSPRASQPMANEDGSLQLVFNGEVYNFEILSEGLRGRHEFRSESDSEVLLHLYEDEGPAMVQRLRGMFAFAIWDRGARRLFLARDRLGKKPLFYAVEDGCLLFASELGALLDALARKPKIREDGIRSFLNLGYVPGGDTVYEGVHKLPPAHTLTFDESGVRLERYWALGYEEQPAAENAGARFMEVFDEAVRMRLRSDVPLGAFLSGGVDSSAVVALARRHLDRFHTFSVDFEDPAFDESRYSQLVAQALGTDHHGVTCRPGDLDLLPLIARHYGEPFADSSAIPTFVVSRLARSRVTVVLTGDGGDENFGGYDRYTAILQSRKIRWIPAPVRRAMRGALALGGPGSGPKSPRRLARRFLEIADGAPETQYRNLVSVFPDADLPFPATASVKDVFAGPFASPGPMLHRMLATDVQSYLPHDLLVKVDIASMAYSLEARAPFLDHVLMEHVAGLPAAIKAKGMRKKIFLKHALKGVVPEAVLRRKKMGFGAPVGGWLRRERSDLLDAYTREPGHWAPHLLGSDRLRSLVQGHLDGTRDRSIQVWALLQLREWERQYESGALLAPSHVLPKAVSGA